MVRNKDNTMTNFLFRKPGGEWVLLDPSSQRHTSLMERWKDEGAETTMVGGASKF